MLICSYLKSLQHLFKIMRLIHSQRALRAIAGDSNVKDFLHFP